MVKYPRAETFLKQHPEMDIDQAIEFLKKELEGSVKHDKYRDYSKLG